MSGVLGDQHAGPAVHVIHGAANARIVPPACWSTEIVILVVKGSATVDSKPYSAGEIRVQGENKPIGAIIAGDSGVELVFVIADRRASANFALNPEEVVPAWPSVVDLLRP